MKYIKTAWGEILGIVKIEKSHIGDLWYCPKRKKDSVHSDFVEKESDTLEELCDFFVYKRKGKTCFAENKHSEAFYELLDRIERSHVRESPIYGYNDFKLVAVYDGEWRVVCN